MTDWPYEYGGEHYDVRTSGVVAPHDWGNSPEEWQQSLLPLPDAWLVSRAPLGKWDDPPYIQFGQLGVQGTVPYHLLYAKALLREVAFDPGDRWTSTLTDAYHNYNVSQLSSMKQELLDELHRIGTAVTQHARRVRAAILLPVACLSQADAFVVVEEDLPADAILNIALGNERSAVMGDVEKCIISMNDDSEWEGTASRFRRLWEVARQVGFTRAESALECVSELPSLVARVFTEMKSHLERGGLLYLRLVVVEHVLSALRDGRTLPIANAPKPVQKQEVEAVAAVPATLLKTKSDAYAEYILRIKTIEGRTWDDAYLKWKEDMGLAGLPVEGDDPRNFERRSSRALKNYQKRRASKTGRGVRD